MFDILYIFAQCTCMYALHCSIYRERSKKKFLVFKNGGQLEEERLDWSSSGSSLNLRSVKLGSEDLFVVAFFVYVGESRCRFDNC